MKNKIRIFFTLLLVFGLIFPGCSRKSKIDLNTVPNYLKEIYPTLTSEGIRVNYNPYVGDDIKLISHVWSLELEKELENEKFSSSWIKGSFELPTNEPVDSFFMFDSKNGIVVTSGSIMTDEGHIMVLHLYQITNGKISLLQTLDKAPRKGVAEGGAGGNTNPQINKDFVVWSAFVEFMSQQGHIWVYDIKKRESFEVPFYEENRLPNGWVIDGPNTFLYHLYPDDKLIVQSLFEDPKSNEFFTCIKLYDLNIRKDETIVLSKDYNYIVEINGYNSALIDDTLFVTRCKLYQTQEENKKFASYTDIANREVVQIDLKTKQIFPFIPRHFIVYGSLKDSVLLVAFDPDYAYQDVWLYNAKNKTLDCVLKVPVRQSGGNENYFVLSPNVYLLHSGLLCSRDGWYSIIPGYYFSFTKRKPFYVGNFVPSFDGNYFMVYDETSNNQSPKVLLIKPE